MRAPWGSTFGIVRLAVPNTRAGFSPYGQSVFADAVDAVQSVDLAYDALINEVDAGKMRVFLSDVMFDQERTADGRRVPIPAFSQVKVDSSLCRFPTLRPGHACAPSFRYQRA